MWGTTIGVIKGDSRSLDNGSNRVIALFDRLQGFGPLLYLLFRSKYRLP